MAAMLLFEPSLTHGEPDLVVANLCIAEMNGLDPVRENVVAKLKDDAVFRFRDSETAGVKQDRQ